MIAMAFVDVCWTLYFINLVERRAHAAALWSTMIILITAFIFTIYIKDAIYIMAASIGAYIGTLGTITWEKKGLAISHTITPIVRLFLSFRLSAIGLGW